MTILIHRCSDCVKGIHCNGQDYEAVCECKCCDKAIAKAEESNMTHDALRGSHTPTPWELAGRNGICEINDGKVIAEIKGFSTTDREDEINAAFIVRAVNAHRDLLKFVKYVRAKVVHDPIGAYDGFYGYTPDDLDALIAKAEGK